MATTAATHRHHPAVAAARRGRAPAITLRGENRPMGGLGISTPDAAGPSSSFAREKQRGSRIPAERLQWGCQIGWTGRAHDEATGTIYFRNRIYEPDYQFLSRDPAMASEDGLPKSGDGYQDGYSLYRAYFVPNATDPTGLGVNGPERYMVVGVSGFSGEPSGAWTVARDLKAKKIGFDESLEMGHMFWAPDANYGTIRNWMKDDKSQGGCECKSIMIISISWGARNATYVAEWFERTYGFKAAAQGIVEGVAPIPLFGGGGGAWNRIGPAKVMVNYYVGTPHWPTGAAISGATNHDMSGEITTGHTGMDLHIDGEWIGARHVQDDFVQARLLTSCGH